MAERKQYKQTTNVKAEFETINNAVSFLVKTIPDNGVTMLSVKVGFTIEFSSVKQAVDWMKKNIPPDAKAGVNVTWEKMDWPYLD